MMSTNKGMAMLEKRRIEAAILKHVYKALKAKQGIDIAKRTVAEAVRRRRSSKRRRWRSRR